MGQVLPPNVMMQGFGSNMTMMNGTESNSAVVVPALVDAFLRVTCSPISPIGSLGFFNGENPAKSYLPLLLMQICVMNVISRTIRFLLRPLHQPEIVSDILAGIMVGPTALGRIKGFSDVLFPQDSIYLLRTLAHVGTMLLLLIEGMKMDPMLILKTGKMEVVIAAWGILSSFVVTILTFFLRSRRVGPFLIFLSSLFSLTAFPVLNPILREYNLLNSQLGRLALSVVSVNYVISWATLIGFHAWFFSGNSLLKAFLFLAFFFILILFISVVIRPAAMEIIHQTPQGGAVESCYITAIHLMAAAMAFLGEALGTGASHGALILGLAIPDGPPLASAFVEKTQSILELMLMPLFYASVGLRTNMLGLTGNASWENLVAAIITSFSFKLLGTAAPALYYKIPLHDSLALGLMMNLRGVVELILYIQWIDFKFMGEQAYKTLVLAALIQTSISAPLVKFLIKRRSRSYTPYGHRTIEHSKTHGELRILTCVHGQESVPGIINLLEASHSHYENPICVYVLDLVELVGRANPILIEHETITKKKSSWRNQSDRIIGAFRNFEQRKQGSIWVKPFTVMAPYNTMYHDVCMLALDRKVSLVILPYHKQRTMDEMNVVNRAFRTINPAILAEAPSSVGVLVDRGRRSHRLKHFTGKHSYRVGVLFSGGPDCREVLSYGLRMAGHPSVTVTVVRFIPRDDPRKYDLEMKLDDEAVVDFKAECRENERAVYKEEMVSHGEETVKVIRSMRGDHDLVMVGRRMGMGSPVVRGLMDWSERPDLGLIGDMLAAPDFFENPVLVLVVQQQLNLEM